jgi:hypothetical protein
MSYDDHVPPAGSGPAVRLRRALDLVRLGRLGDAEAILLDWDANVNPGTTALGLLLKADAWVAIAKSAVRNNDAVQVENALNAAISALLSEEDKNPGLVRVSTSMLLDIMNQELHHRGVPDQIVFVGSLQPASPGEQEWSVSWQALHPHISPSEEHISTIEAVIEWARSRFKPQRRRRKRRPASIFVITDDTEVLAQPNKNLTPADAPVLPAGSVVRILERGVGWYRVRDEEGLGLNGWVPAEFVHAADPLGTVEHFVPKSWLEEPPIAVVADLDAVPPELIAELIAALDELHRAHGGGGLRILRAQTGSEVREGATV